jgi:hypothetical protein
MSKILLAFLVGTLVPFSLYASTDVSSDSTSANLANLNYYPHAGKLTIEPSYDGDLNTWSGGERQSRSALIGLLEYGLPWVNGLRINVEESTIINTTSLDQDTFVHSGVGDPTFSASYRILDDTPGGFSLDTQISATPSFASADIAYGGQPGGVGNGGLILQASATGFWRAGLNEVSLGGTLSHDFDATLTDPRDEGNDVAYASRWIGQFTLRDRIHLLPVLFLQGEANFTFANSRQENPDNGSSTEIDNPFNVSPTLGVGFLAKPDVLLSLYIEYQGYETRYPEFETSSTFGSTTYGFHVLIEL